MKTIEKEATVLSDGSLLVKNVPFAPGDEVIINIRKKDVLDKKKVTAIKGITAAEILASDFVGSWDDRDDLPDSPEYARSLRERVEKREW